MPTHRTRDVDKLDPAPDQLLAQQDAQYLDRHKLEPLFRDILSNIVTLKPMDPVQYIIDCVEYNADYAKQDPTTGLPEHRRAKLEDVFRLMDKEGRGKVSFQGLEQYTQKYGGNTLQENDLASIFKDFQPRGGSVISLEEFLVFFSKVSVTIPNSAFNNMVKELTA